VEAFYISNTPFTSITKTSKSTFNSRDVWLVLPTLYAAQCFTVKIKARNIALSEQKPHHRASENSGDVAGRIQKHQRTPLKLPLISHFF
jgi:hypothetical protein